MVNGNFVKFERIIIKPAAYALQKNVRLKIVLLLRN